MPELPTLSYEQKRPPNPWAKVSLIGGVVLFFGSLVPICGLVAVPFGWLGVIVGIVGMSLAIWGGRRGLVMSISGSLLCFAAAFIPLGVLSATPLLAELGLKYWASKQNTPAAIPAPTTTPSTSPATTTASSTAPVPK